MTRHTLGHALSRHSVALAIGFIAAALLWPSPGVALQPGFTGGPRLASIYETILSARFDMASRQIAEACPPAPVEACQALNVVASWWRIVLDPDNRQWDQAFERDALAAIAAADRWTTREPARAEAWFYVAGAYAPLVQWRVLRGERLTAAREAARIKRTLERALALDPTMHDAHFGIGLYRYYADVVPAAGRLLQWLLLLPGGDRDAGLKQMLQARDRGQFLKDEADFQLHLVYLWYERQPIDALTMVERLDRKYPTNPVFLQRISHIHRDYLHDVHASAAAWQRLLARAEAGSTAANALSETHARLGLARDLDALSETDKAIDQLQQVVQRGSDVPYGAQARAYLALGNARQRLGDVSGAQAAYASARRDVPADNPDDLRSRIRDAERRRAPSATVAEAYRVSLEGLRALERGASADARTLLERAVSLSPTDHVIRARYIRSRVATGDDGGARTEIERLLKTPSLAPHVQALLCVEYAGILERAGDRTRAIEFYRRAYGTRGGANDDRRTAERALERLGS